MGGTIGLFYPIIITSLVCKTVFFLIFTPMIIKFLKSSSPLLYLLYVYIKLQMSITINKQVSTIKFDPVLYLVKFYLGD